MSSLPMTPQQRIQAEEPRTTPRKTSQGSRGNQGPHLERLGEHLRKLQDDLQSCSASRHPSVTGQGGQEGMGSAGTPRTATPRGRSFLKVLSEQQRLQKELSAAEAARQAAEARALVSADEAAAAAQWAQAVTHENEKLHQLTGLQKAIVGSLQDGHRMADAAVRRADELARTSQHAQRDSLEASKLHSSLLQHTGHAKALEESMEAMKSTLKALRHDLGAKDAELAITKAEAEAFRRQLVPGAGSTLHADTEMLSGGEAQKQRLKGMHERILQRTMPIEEVWLEVQHCEERVQLLCTITRAMETHVILLQDELCKAHSETAEVRGKLSEQEQLAAELRHAAATAAAAAERVPKLEALLATQERAGGEAWAAAAASDEPLAAALQDLKAAQEDLSRLRAREASTKAILSTIAAADLAPKEPLVRAASHGCHSHADTALALPREGPYTTASCSPSGKDAGSAAAEQAAAERDPLRGTESARRVERHTGAASGASASPPRALASSAKSRAAPGHRLHSAAAAAAQSAQRSPQLRAQAPEQAQRHLASPDQHASPEQAPFREEQPEPSSTSDAVAAGPAQAQDQDGSMELREPEEETLGQVGNAVPVQLPRAAGQSHSCRAAAEEQGRRATQESNVAEQLVHSSPPELFDRSVPKGSPAPRQHEPLEILGAKAGAPSSTGMERGMSAALMSPGRMPEQALSAQHGSLALTFASLIPQSSPLHARVAAQQKEEQPHRESIIPRIWRSTVKRPLSAESDADIRSIPDTDKSLHASPCTARRASASPIIGVTKVPKVEASPIGSLGKGVCNDDNSCLIKAHAGGEVSSDCRDSMCEGAAVTSTFISLGEVLRGTPLTGAQSISAQPELRGNVSTAAAEASGSGGGAARSGVRGEKRDVRGLRVAQQPADVANSASPSGGQRTWSGYIPVKLQDLAQIREQPDAPESGSQSARSSQASAKNQWAPLASRRGSPPLNPKKAEVSQRSPLTEVYLGSAGSPAPESLPDPAGKVGPAAAAKRSLPDMEVCLSPALPLSGGPPSFGSTLPNKGLQKARRPKKPPTPRGAPGLRASFSGDLTSAQIGRPTGVAMLDASLCNVVGSPMSPPDGQWAELHPGMQGSVNSRPEPSPATGAVQARLSPADEAILRANQALSTRADRRANPENPRGLGPAGTPEAEVSADVARLSVRGPRHKVPLLNLSTESLRMSVEAVTPPCSFPLRGQAKAEREARWAAAAQARPTGRSDSSEEDQATYDLAANAAAYNEGLHQLDASSCNILKESSTFICEPAPPACEQQPPGQAADGTPRRDAPLMQQMETPPESARRKTSFFQRLSPLLGKKEGAGSQEATPQKTVLEPSPSKGFGKLSPARWGWGKGSKKAAGRNLAAETCSPLRDGASAMSHSEASSQAPKGRRRLSPKKMTPWLGK